MAEKVKNWVTWDALLKDLKPYMYTVGRRMETHNPLFIQDHYILELIIIPKIQVVYSKAFDEYTEVEKSYVKAYSDVVADIMKLYRHRNKLNDVLESHPELEECEKEGIRTDWKKEHAIKRKAKGGENLMVEYKNIEEYFKAQCSKLADISADLRKVSSKKGDVCEYANFIYRIKYRLSQRRVFLEVHIASSECLLEITKLYRTHITAQSEEVSFISELIHLCEEEKNETVKSSLRKCIESLKRENISTD